CVLDFLLKALYKFYELPMPQCVSHLYDFDFNEILDYVKPSVKYEKSWDDVPDEIKAAFDILGILGTEQKYLAGVSAQYEAEVVYYNM
ncbi:Fe-S cluster assembly protein SufB, partial [Bacillus cereus]|nr:Fe-S cluster assembly protein SufB [Bacillus cereus]